MVSGKTAKQLSIEENAKAAGLPVPGDASSSETTVTTEVDSVETTPKKARKAKKAKR